MDPSIPTALADPLDLEFDNDPLLLFEDEVFQQVLMSPFPLNQHPQLDEDQSLEALFAASQPAVVDEQGRGTQIISSCSGLLPTLTDNTSRKEHPCSYDQHTAAAAQLVEAGPDKKISNKTKGKKNLAVEIERQRRREMAALHCSLRSLLPAHCIKGKRSMSDHLHEAVRYIKDLEGRIKELSVERDELILMKRSGCCSSNNSGSNEEYVTTVNPCGQGFIEIVATTTLPCDIDSGNNNEENQPRPALSNLLHFLGNQGLSVVNCVSSRVDNHLTHSIQAQVDDGRDIDLSDLQKQLTHYL